MAAYPLRIGEVPSETPLAGVQWSETATTGSKGARSIWPEVTPVRKTAALSRPQLRLFFLGGVP